MKSVIHVEDGPCLKTIRRSFALDCGMELSPSFRIAIPVLTNRQTRPYRSIHPFIYVRSICLGGRRISWTSRELDWIHAGQRCSRECPGHDGYVLTTRFQLFIQGLVLILSRSYLLDYSITSSGVEELARKVHGGALSLVDVM